MRGRTGRGAVVVACLLFAAVAAGSKARNRAYVASGPGQFGDVFYARCTPRAAEGTAGHTEVFRVGESGGDDELVDRYDWFAPGGVVLAWSPLKGKVAVLAMMREGPAEDWKRREALRISLGGERLASYTNEDLLALGARPSADSAHGQYAGHRVIGCEQVPGTNEYDFVVDLSGTLVRFDITTGKPRPATTQPAPGPPPGP